VLLSSFSLTKTTAANDKASVSNKTKSRTSIVPGAKKRGDEYGHISFHVSTVTATLRDRYGPNGVEPSLVIK
jgi:hypothetical protein